MNDLVKLDRARIMLAEVRTFPEAKKIRDFAEAAKVYARAEKMGVEIQNYAGEIVAEATRRMGEFLIAAADTGQRDRGRGGDRKSRSRVDTVKLSDLGVSKKQSAICQDIARLPQEKFRAHIEAVKSAGEILTTSGLAVAAKRHKRTTEQEKAKSQAVVNLSPEIKLLKASAFAMPLDDKSVQTIVTSPPYFGLREYHGEQGTEPFGEERSVQAYVDNSIKVLGECRRVLRDDGIVFWNIADSYSDPNGGLSLVPERVVIAAQADGWVVRSIIIWAKLNPMPESVKNRPTRAYEKIFMLTKSTKYFWDSVAASEPSTGKTAPFPKLGKTHGAGSTRNDIKYDRDAGKRPSDYFAENRNIRNVWTFAVPHTTERHFATFPEELPRRCIAVATRPGDTVLDPFCGSGTTGIVAQRLRRNFIGLDLAYHDIAKQRISEANQKEAA